MNGTILDTGGARASPPNVYFLGVQLRASLYAKREARYPRVRRASRNAKRRNEREALSGFASELWMILKANIRN